MDVPTSKADAPVTLDEPEIEGRYAELDGYTVAFERTSPTGPGALLPEPAARPVPVPALGRGAVRRDHPPLPPPR